MMSRNTTVYYMLPWVKIGQVLFGLLVVTSSFAQDTFPNRWFGTLTQAGSADTFQLQLYLKLEGDLITGTSESRSAQGKVGQFSLVGRWDGQDMLLQEVEQLAPIGERWCIKYYTLHLEGDELVGGWSAPSCPSGTIRLQSAQEWPQTHRGSESFTPVGTWTGRLTQSDRSYGFYFELILASDGTGTSSIVSEDNGGRAWHTLKWNWNAADSTILLEEQQVARKTSAAWKWCIKKAGLHFKSAGILYSLEGAWTGYLEGFTPKTGACASGRVYLEKATPALEVEKEGFLHKIPDSLGSSGIRRLQIQRHIEVASPNLKISLWDNGSVDGDIVSLYLNGKRIAHRIVATKGKATVQVKLTQPLNLLVLYAEDIGSVPPNTVAVSIFDGVREQILILNADLEENGGVLVRQFSAH